jgi:predicted nucleic acid-binding protein
VANSFFLDASALAKRYVPERGSAQVSAIIDAVPGGRLYLLIIGTGEIVSILVRKRNAGVLSEAYFRQALANFESEIVRPADITKLSVTSRLVTASLPLIVAHSINSTDAPIIKSALAVARRLRAAGDDLVLVASDQRLLRVAEAEGLVSFNSETEPQAGVAALLARQPGWPSGRPAGGDYSCERACPSRLPHQTPRLRPGADAAGMEGQPLRVLASFDGCEDVEAAHTPPGADRLPGRLGRDVSRGGNRFGR